jgi:hypothetical protein
MDRFVRLYWLIVPGILLLLFLLPRCSTEVQQDAFYLPETVDYNFHVRPILSDRCFACHGPDANKREAGLRLDTPEGAYALLGPANDHAAVIPGDTLNSTLLARIHHSDPDQLMPPPSTHLSLSLYEKSLLKRWILQGAKYAQHWAFIPPVKSALPDVKNPDWCQNPIDFFVLKKMEEQGLEPEPEAEKMRLLRRVCFDLTGLPPSLELMEKFEKDGSQTHYEQVVDSLLHTKAFAERMTMNWLDLARYSDTHGYQDDLPRTMWPWRDWVIHAFDKNMPYDQFVKWQLAGDLLPQATKEQILATGFNRNHKITQEGGVIDEEYRVEYVADRTNTFGKAFLGLTMECARCHDHKYDPVTTKEYYSLFAFFNNLPETGFVENLTTPKPWMPLTRTDLKGDLKFLNGWKVLTKPEDTLELMVMQENKPDKMRASFVLNRGQYDAPTDPVFPATPGSILPLNSNLSKDRAGLAEWLFLPENPLTARVTVNRIWQEFMGRGLVATPDNFGMQGALPTHPELLDWLAVDFRENGWDMKRLIRQIVCSSSYKQDAACSEQKRMQDPENRWLARAANYRMPYEFIRDQLLASSGLLVSTVGGPSVKPYQPPGLWQEIATEKTADGRRGEFTYVVDTMLENLYRRSLYTYNKRTIPPPTHLSFDAPLRDLCEVQRARTSTPLQALVLLNDEQVLEASRVFAGRLIHRAPQSGSKHWIQSAFRQIVSRDMQSDELRIFQDFYKEQKNRFDTEVADAQLLLKQAGRHPAEHQIGVVEQATLMLTIQLMYNLDEVLTRT